MSHLMFEATTPRTCSFDGATLSVFNVPDDVHKGAVCFVCETCDPPRQVAGVWVLRGPEVQRFLEDKEDDRDSRHCQPVWPNRD